MRRNLVVKNKVNLEEWADKNWPESKPFTEVKEDFTKNNIEEKEICIKIGNSDYQKIEGMKKVLLTEMLKFVLQQIGKINHDK